MAHILVADDEPRIRTLVRKHLEREGHTVTEAQNGLDAWRQTRYARFNLLITDLMMPEIYGMDLITLLEEGDATASMPVLIMGPRAADIETGEKRKVPIKRSKGGILIIEKPFNPKQMVEMAQVLLASPAGEVGYELRAVPASAGLPAYEI